MKKTFQFIGLISLLLFSFFITDKTAVVIKNMDDIIIQIKNHKDEYKFNGKDAVIKGDGIVSGISAKKVNINKSYQKMKEYGKYNDDLFVYDYIKPNVSIENNKDKYIISGNPSRRMISVNFLVDEDTDITNIINISQNRDIKVSFFINSDWLENNLELAYNLINEGYDFGIIATNIKDYKWMNTIISKIGKQKEIYCYYKNKKSIDNCVKIEGFTIKGLYIKNNYYQEVINNINSGIIFNFKISSDLENNLDNIINYILKKGYKIENLTNHIIE